MNTDFRTEWVPIIAEFDLDAMLPWIVGAGVFFLILLLFRVAKPIGPSEQTDPWDNESESARPDARPDSAQAPSEWSSLAQGSVQHGLPTERRPSFMERLVGFLVRGLLGSGILKVTKAQNIEMVDPKTGKRSTFDSLDDLPPSVRSAIASAGGAIGETGYDSISSTDFPSAIGGEVEILDSPDAPLTVLNSVTGEQRVYNSLEDLPADLRARWEQLKASGGARIVYHDKTTGRRHEFRSLDEAPPEIRAQIESLKAGAGQQEGIRISSMKQIGPPQVRVKFGGFERDED